MSFFIEDISSKHQCSLRKGFGTQQCFLKFLEKRKNAGDKGKVFGVQSIGLPQWWTSYFEAKH